MDEMFVVLLPSFIKNSAFFDFTDNCHLSKVNFNIRLALVAFTSIRKIYSIRADRIWNTGITFVCDWLLVLGAGYKQSETNLNICGKKSSY